MKTVYSFFIGVVLFTSGCIKKPADQVGGGSIGGNPQNDNVWSIPKNKVVDGGPGKDGIPSINEPKFVSISEVNFMQDQDLVNGVMIGNEIKAYSHNILNWHEIVNDNVGGQKIAIIHCPLTGTSTAWSRVLDSRETTFGVSGLLYNTNVIPYDRGTNNNWSQLLFKSVNGTLIDKEAETFRIIETTWKTWKTMFPNSKVLSTNTGFNRSYVNYPYGDYRTNQNALLFSIEPDDSRLPRKERVLAVIINKAAKVYRFSSVSKKGGVLVDIAKGEQIALIGSESKNLFVAFKNKLPNGQPAQFRLLENNGTNLFDDQLGNLYNAFGMVTEGVDKGKQLDAPNFLVGFWMAFGSFYPNVELFVE